MAHIKNKIIEKYRGNNRKGKEDMTVNGVFKKKKGFTIVENSITRNDGLSLKAKGLFSLISSYITMESLILTKKFIFDKCMEGEKAFESTWIELKEKGYLKVYMKPGSKNGWIVEYELLDEPREGAHTYYLRKSGELSETNITRAAKKNKKKDTSPAIKALPQKVGYADRTPQKGSNASRDNAEGGNKVITPSKTLDNTIINQSINLIENIDHSEMTDGVIDIDNGIPLSFCDNKNKMTKTIKRLAEWKLRMTDNIYKNERAEYKLFVEALSEMTTEKNEMTYKGQKVKSTEVVHKINNCLKEDEMGSLDLFINSTLEDYTNGINNTDVKAYKAYMKSCIWNSFSTFRVRFKAEFNKNQYRVLCD